MYQVFNFIAVEYPSQSPPKHTNIILFFEERNPGEKFKAYLQRKASHFTKPVKYDLKEEHLFLKSHNDFNRL